ncbi:uncharacterized protein IL334_006906 [Kwoniella shivajii]|uniref:Protein kinase domain-containing protein n=1 Tax=Kwoniella shivajii TaxID=564305 RepID=A0ABZ1D7N9_9TREE|nr:hypothetical protein IL334_006906 [Kwoniella shivajii]
MPFDIHHLFGQSIAHNDGPHSAHKKKEYVFDNKVIGAGGYSKVLKAKWKARGGMVVAMKIVKKEAVQDREAYLRLIDSGFPRINKHPNICAGLDWFETTNKFYVTFPLLTGGELLERLNTRGRFTEDATKKVMRVMLDTLAFIHSHGIIHRDIKPDNFLYRTKESEVDDIVLIDFGISKVLEDESEDDVRNQFEAGGTPGYAAPEVFCGMGYGKNSDLFGVGVIAYNLLSSWSPWESMDTMALIQETAHAGINFPPGPFEGVSDQAKAFVKHLVQPPSRRPSAKKALQHPWLVGPVEEEDQDHILATHELENAELDQVQPHPTLKPEHPLARQITNTSASGIKV